MQRTDPGGARVMDAASIIIPAVFVGITVLSNAILVRVLRRHLARLLRP